MRHTSDWLVNGYVKSGVINKLWVRNCQSFEGMVREWGNREQRASWLNVKGRLRGLRQGGSRCVSEPRSKSLPNAKVDSLCQGPGVVPFVTTTATIFCQSCRPSVLWYEWNSAEVWIPLGSLFRVWLTQLLLQLCRGGPAHLLRGSIPIADIMEGILSRAYEQVNRRLCLPRCTQWHLSSCLR